MGTQTAITFVLWMSLYTQFSTALYSSKLVHRFSQEAVSYWSSKGKNITLPKLGSLEHMKVLLSSDLKRQKLKLGSQDRLLIPSQGSETFFYGNDMGWLHYTWIDIGTPNVSFLVALDAGSDLFWVPCRCIQCAPLSSSYYSMLDRDLSEYEPSRSSTSKPLSCSHQLCELGLNCQSPNGSCPYSVNYSENTSSSGLLFEDQLYLTSSGGGAPEGSIQAQVIIGCGSKQSGSDLDGSAPDGLLGLGPGKIAIPSLLARSGLVPHSFSYCFDNSYSGRMYFGDQGPATQRSTTFVPYKGEYSGYFIEVDDYCIGSFCLKQNGFQAQVDSGSSFTYLPSEDYKLFVAEFDKQMNATRSGIEKFPYCYKARSHGQPDVPSMKFKFALNQSFVIENPMFHIIDYQGDDLYCLGIQPLDGGIGIIGQNFMMGYRLVFDWENLKLGWSHSNCQDIRDSDRVHLTPSPNSAVNPLPTNEQQRTPGGHAVVPAVARRAPEESSAALSVHILYNHYCKTSLLLLHLTLWLPFW
ncbi:aspartic proteinase-like protein 1 isoform X2 [Coffea eugenioides]|uniref:aspartic proteinase-like protein 1 isoform X2 n=1 Tax=Coffea eugenioides TaxID=49369 RepID=UPI000F60EF75|nr:aspartic proteinase-like protein 1 isoform X2 [Coffea eugenioides]